MPTCPGEHRLRSLSLGTLFKRDSGAPDSGTQRREHATILAASYLATTPEIGAPVVFAVPHDDIDEATFRAILAGGAPIGRLDRDWAAIRLLDYASYEQIREFLSIRALVRDWPLWRVRVRSVTRRRGLDFLVEWVTRHRPDLV